MKRDACSKPQAEAKVKAQMPLKLKRDKSQIVIDNSGDKHHCEQQVNYLYMQTFVHFCAHGSYCVPACAASDCHVLPGVPALRSALLFCAGATAGQAVTGQMQMAGCCYISCGFCWCGLAVAAGAATVFSLTAGLPQAFCLDCAYIMSLAQDMLPFGMLSVDKVSQRFVQL